MVGPEGPWRDVHHLELATADHVWWFNNKRIHSSIGYDNPIEHEQKYYDQQHPGQQIAPGKKALH
jgi:putative transposase